MGKKMLILLIFYMCDKMISQWAQIREWLRKTGQGNARKDICVNFFHTLTEDTILILIFAIFLSSRPKNSEYPIET